MGLLIRRKRFIFLLFTLIICATTADLIFLPRISAQEGVVVQPKMIPEENNKISNISLKPLVMPQKRQKTKSQNTVKKISTALFIQPHVVSVPNPVIYPDEAVRKGWQGEVIVALEILTNGTVGRSGISKSSGHNALDQVALREVKTWKFEPATKNGQPVVECIRIPVSFRLKDN